MRRPRYYFGLPAALLVLVALFAAGWAVAGEGGHEGHHHAQAEAAAEAPEAPADDTAAAELERVEAVKVCMVNDQVFERDQIAVEVEGKTYYGCCEMCKTRLAQDTAVRQGTDPLTGETVDKATAVIAAGPDGKVLYFASEANLERFRSQQVE